MLAFGFSLCYVASQPAATGEGDDTDMSNDTITNDPARGEWRTVTGKGVLVLRMRALILALEFRATHGREMDRRFNTLKIAKQETGLKTNKIPVLIEALRVKYNELFAQCEVRTTEGGQS